MLDKDLPILKSNHFWYFVKESFKVLDCSIVFQMYSITKTWRHVNSEGWEKYHDEIWIKCELQYTSSDELFLGVSEIYKCLMSKQQWDNESLIIFLNRYDSRYTSEEINEIMDDCY